MKTKLLLFSIIFLISLKIFEPNEHPTQNNKIYNIFCGVDKNKSNVQTYNKSKIQKINSLSKKRNLDSNKENYEPINIYISKTYISFQIDTFGNAGLKIDPQIIAIIDEVVDDIKNLINITHLDYAIQLDKNILAENGFSDKFDDALINSGVYYDLVILPKINFLINYISSNNILKDINTNRTIVAALYFPNFESINGKSMKIQIKSMILHQFTHILGFLYDSFQYFPGGLKNTTKTQLDQRGINRTYIITPTVIEFAKKYYNCSNITGLELENQSEDEDIPSSHWEARILLGEYMNSIQYNPEIVISEFTLALLNDSGWYKVNYYTGGLMRFGKNKGCDFLNNDCSENTGTTKFKNEFFDLGDNNSPSCSSGRLSRTYNKYKQYNISLIQKYRSIFLPGTNNLGGLTKNADYCFGFTDIEEENRENIFVGSCNLGDGNYGSQIRCRDDSIYNISQSQNILAEVYSNNSFCVLSEAYPVGATPEENNLYNDKFNSFIHPICYEMFCSNHSLTIKIKNQYVVCPRKGGKVRIDGDFQGFLYCPDYNLICTGTNMCNDLFECIRNKSLPRNSTYDYEFNNEKTSSQKIPQIKSENIEYGYEINEEGICPEYCTQCRDIKRCFKCIDGYKLLGNKDNDSQPIICDKDTDTSIGYFEKDDVFFPCIQFCDECDNSFTCIKCDNIHKTNNDKTKCIDKVTNCESYTNTDFTCTKCKGEYVFIGNDRENCYIINDKNRYYTLDDGISYFPCNTSISNCDICNNNKDICSQCKENYYLINDNRTFCFNDKNLSKYYTNDNNISYIFCNNSIPFCDTCDNGTTCKTCGYNHYFIKENRTHCVTGYNRNKYFTEDNGISYYPCNESIDKCDECDRRDICKKCEKDYYFIGDNRVECINDFNKSKYYTEDNISYYLCNTNFDFCEECSSKTNCTKCFYNYGFPGTDRSKCIFVNNNEYYTEDYGLSFYPCYTNLLNCQKCLNKTYCTKCNETFNFIEEDRTKCYTINNYNEYYTEDNGYSYYPCNTGIENCKFCSAKYDCEICRTPYYFIKNDRNNCVNDKNLKEYYSLDEGISYFPCNEIMENCKNCEEPTTCLKCQENTFFLRTDTSKCLSINDKQHYTEDGIHFYPCSDNMNYCVECYNKNYCSRCAEHYFLKYEISNQCFNFIAFQNDKTYYQLNETHYKKCSSSINNCLYCENGPKCIQCEENHFFLNDNFTRCVHINQLVPSDEYYKIDEKNYYSCGYEKIVENCKKCENPYSCLKCEDGYAFQSDLYNKCYSKEDMKKGFYHNEQETMYYPCMDNCDYCVNGEECLQCSTNYDLIFDNKECGKCQIELINIMDDLNLETVHSFARKYMSKTTNNLTYIPYYINQNKNYSIIILHSWECTKHLFSMGYFSLDTSKLNTILFDKNSESLSSLTYVFVNYDNNQNYIEIYNKEGDLINLKQMCPECLDTEYIIKNNISDIILNSFGKLIIEKLVLNNINVFNESDPVFSNFCSNFTIQDIDIPLKERRNMLFIGNHANELICLDSSCIITNVTINEYSGSCDCKIQSELSLILQNKTDRQIIFDKKGNTNFPVFTCYKEGFNKKILKSNIGFFIGIALIVIQILSFVLYLIFSKSKKIKVPPNPPNPNSTQTIVNSNDNSEILFLENFDEIMKENGKKIINDNENQEMDYQDKDELEEDLVSQEDEELENKRTLDYLLTTEGPLSQRGKRHNSKLKDFNSLKEKNLALDTYSVNIHSGKRERNEKLFLKDSENEGSIKYNKNKKRLPFSKYSEVNSKSSFESNDEFNVKGLQKKNFTSRIYTSLIDAKKYDKTSFCEYYFLILGLRQPIVNLCVSNKCLHLGEDYVPFTIKIIRFCFFLTLNIFMNTLHLNHNYFYEKFEYFDKKYDLRNLELEKKISSNEIFLYAFKNTFLRGFICFIICYLVQELLNRYIINNRKEIDTLINSTIGKVKDEKMKDVLTNKKKKYIILVSVNFVFMLGFYFCIINFYGPYRGGLIDYLTASFITFIFMQVFPFILCLIFSLIRYFGLKKSDKRLYKIGQLLIY